MSEVTPPTESTDSAADAESPQSETAPSGRPRGRKRRFAWRWSRRMSTFVVAVVAAFFVSLFTIDLGRVVVPHYGSLADLAEEAGSRYLKRPLHVGGISAKLSPGEFVLTDVVIEGLEPGDRPFFRAPRINVRVPWWTLFGRRLEVELDLYDWEMVVESWAGGRHSVPKLKPDPSDEPAGPRRFTTTVRFANAHNGTFIYEDHGAPWSVVAPNLDFSLVRSETYSTYLGLARFTGGTVQIHEFLPMATEMSTRFTLEGGLVDLRHIDLLTDGAESHLTGQVDLGNWPEQTYNVSSTVDFPRMRELFFANETWDLAGEGDFRGVFHVYSGGQDLIGEFASDLAGVNGLQFSSLHGSLEWLPDRFRVTHAEADLYGGRTQFTYALVPLRSPIPTAASFTATYSDVDLGAFLGTFDLASLAPTGRADGDLSLAWPNGRFGAGKAGDGHVLVTSSDATIAPAALPSGFIYRPAEAPVDDDDFEGRRALGSLPMGADVVFHIEPDKLVFDDSWAATESTYVAFSGETAYGDDSLIPFHVTSLDWQASDRLLAAIMTAFGAPTGAVQVGGYGMFDGTMTESFRAPLVAGRFTSEAMRAWDVTWGRAVGDIVIQNGYLDITGGRIGDGDVSRIEADGRFALGYPRKDGGEEINAHVVVTDWPLADIRHAFDQDEWPVQGTVALADLQLNGPYEGMFGSGSMHITDGTAWDESFPTATAQMTFEGNGVRMSAIEMVKGTGRITGGAWIGWDGRYVFDADGRAVPVESLDNFQLGPDAPLTGLLRFTAGGAGAFENPEYAFSGTIGDLFIGDEGIGQVAGQLSVRDEVLTISDLNVTETRVQLNAGGTIALNELSDARLFVSLQDTSIDPYLKFVGPEVSPFTDIIVSGRVQVAGPLGDVPNLRIDATIDDALVTPLDYEFTNDGPVQLTLADNRVTVGGGNLQDVARFSGENTQLDLSGGVDLGARTIDITTSGDADLAILPVFFSGITASGAATVSARIAGAFDEPTLTGTATVIDGSIRHFDLPHSLTAIDGPIRIRGSRIDVSGLTAQMGEGDVQFSGGINLRGYTPEEFDVHASGQLMRLRYPEGFTSHVNAELDLLGPVGTPRLGGTVEVLTVDYRLPITASANLLDLAGGTGLAGVSAGPVVPTGFPLLFDIGIQVGQMPLIQNDIASIDGSALLRFTGTVDRPSLTGRVAIDGGEVFFEGNRYSVRQGSVDFDDYPRLDSVFDVEAVTRPRAAGQTYEVTVRMTGTFDELTPTLTSDPFLPDTDIITLLFGGTPDLGADRALQTTVQQERMLQTAGAVLLASPVSGTLSTVVRQVLPVSTVQLSPVLIGDQSASLQQLNPSARFTVGQRITSQLYLTYSRVLGATQDEIILLEYDQNDRVSWLLSRNENRTFALDFRLRYIF